MLRKMILTLTLLSSVLVAANACDFNFKVNGNKKSCHPGDIVEVTVELVLTTPTVAPTGAAASVEEAVVGVAPLLISTSA